jgi:phosphoribosyl-AMP cyclohydrolase
VRTTAESRNGECEEETQAEPTGGEVQPKSTNRGRHLDRYDSDEMPPTITPIPYTSEELDAVAWDANGLVGAIVQEAGTGQVLMFAWMNRESLEHTLQTGRTWFWSRSRGELWCKGETSGDRQYVREAYYDCDGDTLLFVVDQEGKGACHTGERTCFFRSFADPAG